MKKNVMIVDDEPDQILTIKLFLEDFVDEYDIISADSGKKCIELLKQDTLPDVILLDIMMPEMNGWEVHKELKKTPEWKNIPIIFLTATQDKTSQITGKEISNGYIEKPFNGYDLKKKIDNIIYNHY